MKSMVFEDSVFEECYFEDITSIHTIFRNCTFVASLFYNTGKYEQKFISLYWSYEYEQGSTKTSMSNPKYVQFKPAVMMSLFTFPAHTQNSSIHL